MDALVNGGYSTVATAPSPATSGTSLTLQTGDGIKFPAAPFDVSLYQAGTMPLFLGSNKNAEIARCTALPQGLLTTALTNGVAVTTLAVSALTAAMTSGQNITLVSGTNVQTFVLSANALLGAMSVSVTSQNANFSYPIGTLASGDVMTLTRNYYNTTAQSVVVGWAVDNAVTANLFAQLLNGNALVSGADPTGSIDASPFIMAAYNSLPTQGVLPPNGGRIWMPPGVYKIASAGVINLLGQGISLFGAGKASTVLMAYGTGDCLRFAITNFTTINSGHYGSDTSAQTVPCGGTLRGFSVDGQNAGAGSAGIHYGDSPFGIWDDVEVRNFKGSGSSGVHMDNVYGLHSERQNWTGVSLHYNTTNLKFDVNGGSSPWPSGVQGSFDYGQYSISIIAEANCDGIVVSGGATLQGTGIKLVGNFQSSASTNSGAVLRLTGSGTDSASTVHYSQITQGALNFAVEADGGLVGHQTINFGSSTSNTIYQCTGELSFALSFQASNYATATPNWAFYGPIVGDTTLPSSNVTVPATYSTTNSPMWWSSFGTTATANTHYQTPVFIPFQQTITGITFVNQGTVAGNVYVAFYNSAGTRVAESASTAQTTTYANQFVPFTSTYVAAPGIYYMTMIPSSSTATFLFGNALGSVTAAVGSVSTPPSTISVPFYGHNQVPAMSTY